MNMISIYQNYIKFHYLIKYYLLHNMLHNILYFIFIICLAIHILKTGESSNTLHLRLIYKIINRIIGNITISFLKTFDFFFN